MKIHSSSSTTLLVLAAVLLDFTRLSVPGREVSIDELIGCCTRSLRHGLILNPVRASLETAQADLYRCKIGLAFQVGLHSVRDIRLIAEENRRKDRVLLIIFNNTYGAERGDRQATVKKDEGKNRNAYFHGPHYRSPKVK